MKWNEIESQLIHYIPAAIKSCVVNTVSCFTAKKKMCRHAIYQSKAQSPWSAKSPQTIFIHQVAARPWQCADRISPIKPKRRNTCDRKQASKRASNTVGFSIIDNYCTSQVCTVHAMRCDAMSVWCVQVQRYNIIAPHSHRTHTHTMHKWLWLHLSALYTVNKGIPIRNCNAFFACSSVRAGVRVCGMFSFNFIRLLDHPKIELRSRFF